MHDDFFQLHLCNYLEKVFVVKLSFGFGDVTLPLKKPELFFIFPFLGFFFHFINSSNLQMPDILDSCEYKKNSFNCCVEMYHSIISTSTLYILRCS